MTPRLHLSSDPFRVYQTHLVICGKNRRDTNQNAIADWNPLAIVSTNCRSVDNLANNGRPTMEAYTFASGNSMGKII